MKVRFVWIGKTRNPAVDDLIQEYRKRVERFCRVEVAEIRDRPMTGRPEQLIEREGEEILSRVEEDGFVVVLDEAGRELRSVELAGFIEGHRVAGTRQMTFIIGGHAGTSEAVRKRADLVLALSRMTLTHELARVFLVEQIYRAFAIINGLPYQK